MDSLYTMPLMPNFGFPNMCDGYSSQVYLNNMTGFDSYIPPFNNNFCNPWMSMDDSVFNCPQYQMPYMGCAPGYNMDNYYKQMVDYQQKSREADATLKKTMRDMRQARRTLEDKIINNEQQQILPAFKEYVNKVAAYNGDTDGSYEDMKNTAIDMYEEQTGKALQTHIRENGNSSFVHGLKEVGFLGFGDKVSAEQNIAKITGTKEGKTEGVLKSAGNATAGAAYGLAGALLAPKVSAAKLPKVQKLPVIGKIFNKGGSVKVKAALAIGAAAGWLYGKVLDNFS